MADRKKFFYKVYNSSGRLLTVWDNDVVGASPVFTSRINGGKSSVVIRLNRDIDNFGEDSDVAFNNEVQIHVRDDESTGMAIYSGYIAKYSPKITSNGRFVDVTIYPYEAQLSRYLLRDDSADTTITFSSEDPSTILTTVLDYYNDDGGKIKGFSTGVSGTISNLQGYWAFDDGSGSTAIDSSGNGNDGTLNNMEAGDWIAGVKGTALRFDGTNEYVAVNHGAELDLGNNDDYSVSLWFRSSVKADQSITEHWENPADGYPWSVRGPLVTSGSVNFAIFDGSTSVRITTDEDMADGEWHHLVGIRDKSAGEIRLYIDNELKKSLADTINNDVSNDTDIITIGARRSGTNEFNGDIDEFRVYNKVLSTTEIEQLFKIKSADIGVGMTGTTVTYTFNTQMMNEVVEKCRSFAPTGWYWYVDADNFLHFKAKKTDYDHLFYVGGNIAEITTEKRVENVINRVYFTGGDDAIPGDGTPLYRVYERSGSVSSYGLYGMRMTDRRVTLQATAEIMADHVLDAQDTPESRFRIKVIDSNGTEGGYDIESINPGDTCKILNNAKKSYTTWDNSTWDTSSWDYDVTDVSATVLQIVSMEYHADFIILELSTRLPSVTHRIEDIKRNLDSDMAKANPTAPS